MRLFSIAVGVLTAALLIVGIARSPLIDPDEARFARTTVEMERAREFVVPTFQGAPRLEKPPLLHWVQMPLFRAFGASEWTARLPGALATWLSIALTAWIARRRFGDEGGLWAAAILATSPLVIVGGRLGTIDALLAVHVLAVIALDIAEPDETSEWRNAAAGALTGLAFLAKGPVAIVVPILVVLAGRTASGRSVWPRLAAVLAMTAGFAATAVPWVVAFVRRLGFDAVSKVVEGEVLGRFDQGVVHAEPAWYYAVVMAVGFMPWIVPTVAGLGRAVVFRAREARARTALYAGAGLFAGLLFFSSVSGKLPTYILPLAPLVAVIATWELGRELEAPDDRTWVPGVMAAAMLAFGVVLLFVSARDLPGHATAAAGLGGIVYLLGGCAAFVGVVRHRPRVSWGSAAATSWAFLAVVAVVFFPAHAESRSSRALVEAVPALRSGAPLAIVDMHLPSLSFYTDAIPTRLTRATLGGWLSAPDDRDPGLSSGSPTQPRVGDDVSGSAEPGAASRRGAFVVFDRRDVPSQDPAALARLSEVGSAGKYVVFSVEPAPRDET